MLCGVTNVYSSYLQSYFTSLLAELLCSVYGIHFAGSNFRVPKDDDVTIKVLYCGICHTDLHIIKNDWGNAMYPVVPG